MASTKKKTGRSHDPERTVDGLTTPAKEISPTTAKDLRTSGYNPRRISPDKLKALKKAMQEFGDLGGVVFNRATGRLVSGHQRGKNLDPTWTITKEDCTDKTGTIALGYIETPDGKFSYREVEWDEQKERAANIAANQHGGEFDEDLLSQMLKELNDSGYDMELTGFDDQELKDLLASFTDSELGEEDPEVEPVENPFVKIGDLWICGESRLLVGDSTSIADVDRLMDGKKADLCWTDPPYGVDYSDKNESLNRLYGKHSRIQTPIENDKFKTVALFQTWLESAFSSMEYALKQGGCFYIASPPAAMETIFRNSIVNTNNLKHSQTLIWVKNSAVLSRTDYNGNHEPIQYGWKEGDAHYFSGDFTQKTTIDKNIDVTQLSRKELQNLINDMRNSKMTTVIRIDRPLKADIHPTMKPVKLIEHCIYASSRAGEIVIDLFNGSGSTLIACRKTGRRYRGCELSPNYVQASLKRYFEYCNEEPMLMETDGKLTPFSEVEKQRTNK